MSEKTRAVGNGDKGRESMSGYVKIYFSDVRPILEGASKKQIAALFLAILDYAETGKEPQRKPKDPFSAWLLSVFPKIKARIDEENPDE